MYVRTLRAIFAIGFVLLAYSVASGHELKSRYATVVYGSDEQLRRLNKDISLGSLYYLLEGRKSVTVNDEVKNKLDVLTERVESILSMYPKEVRFTVVLLPSDKEVQDVLRSKYGKNADYIAFYSFREKTIYVSLSDVDIGVLAHEMAHMIIDLYYATVTPQKIQEVLAQYVESHLKD
jgi:hypothetical protein